MLCLPFKKITESQGISVEMMLLKHRVAFKRYFSLAKSKEKYAIAGRFGVEIEKFREIYQKKGHEQAHINPLEPKPEIK